MPCGKAGRTTGGHRSQGKGLCVCLDVRDGNEIVAACEVRLRALDRAGMVVMAVEEAGENKDEDESEDALEAYPADNG